MFMVLAFVLSMFIDSITVILFLAAITITQGKLLKFDPIPVIIAEIFCSNLGGSSTMCGDPPNIIIGTALHYTFTDFLLNTGVIAILSLVLMILVFICTGIMVHFAMEAASEVGVNLKEGYNGDLTSREAGSVGGQMVKKMIEEQEKQMSGR